MHTPRFSLPLDSADSRASSGGNCGQTTQYLFTRNEKVNSSILLGGSPKIPGNPGFFYVPMQSWMALGVPMRVPELRNQAPPRLAWIENAQTTKNRPAIREDSGPVLLHLTQGCLISSLRGYSCHMETKSAVIGAGATVLLAGGLFFGIGAVNAASGSSDPAPSPSVTQTATPTESATPTQTASPSAIPTQEPVVTSQPIQPAPAPAPAPVVEQPAPAPAPVVEQPAAGPTYAPAPQPAQTAPAGSGLPPGVLPAVPPEGDPNRTAVPIDGH